MALLVCWMGWPVAVVAAVGDFGPRWWSGPPGRHPAAPGRNLSGAGAIP